MFLLRRTVPSSRACWSTSPPGLSWPCAGRDRTLSLLVEPCSARPIRAPPRRAQFEGIAGCARGAMWSTAAIRRRTGRERRTCGSAKGIWSTGTRVVSPGWWTTRRLWIGRLEAEHHLKITVVQAFNCFKDKFEMYAFV